MLAVIESIRTRRLQWLPRHPIGNSVSSSSESRTNTPSIRNDGLFIPTDKQYRIGDEILLLLRLMDGRKRTPIVGKVVWLTPPGYGGKPGRALRLVAILAILPRRALLSGTIDAPRLPKYSRATGTVMLVDSHCHLDRVDLKPYAGEFHRLMDETSAAGIGHMLCVSIDLEHYPGMRKLVAPYPQVSVSVGVHPNESCHREPTPEVLVELAQDERTVAIGETGLDYSCGQGDRDRQHRRFRNHIATAGSCGKPLIIHTRDAPEDTLRILTEEDTCDLGGVLHCFTETWEMAKAALDLGFYISFSGIVTFKAADDLRAVASQVPLDRLLIETDSPYLTPVPHRGKPNEPKFVEAVAQCIAGLRGMPVETLADLTRDNFFRLFRDAVPAD